MTCFLIQVTLVLRLEGERYPKKRLEMSSHSRERVWLLKGRHMASCVAGTLHSVLVVGRCRLAGREGGSNRKLHTPREGGRRQGMGGHHWGLLGGIGGQGWYLLENIRKGLLGSSTHTRNLPHLWYGWAAISSYAVGSALRGSI